mgnify:FL=1
MWYNLRMQFSYVYRKADGSRGTGVLEASDRAAALAELDAKGVAVIRLEVSDGAAPAARPSVWRGALAGLLAAGVALAVWRFLAPGMAPEPLPSAAPAKKAQPLKKSVRPAGPLPRTASAASAADTAKASRGDMLRALSPAERIEFLFKEAEARPINLEPASNRLYATGTEQVLDWVFTTRPGDMPPPLPQIPLFEEAHLAEILVNACRVKDTDDARTRERKEIVDLAKKEMVKFVSEGGAPEDFLRFYHDELRQAHMAFQTAQKEVFAVAREDPDLAADYLRQVNEQLAEKGIKPVRLPPKMAERLGIDASGPEP